MTFFSFLIILIILVDPYLNKKGAVVAMIVWLLQSMPFTTDVVYHNQGEVYNIMW